MIATDRRLAMQGGDLEPLGSKGFGLQKQKQVHYVPALFFVCGRWDLNPHVVANTRSLV